MPSFYKIRLIISIIIFVISFFSFIAISNATNTKSNQHITNSKQIWTCAMHPQIRMDEPGKCPICHMDLIPLEENAGNDSSSSNGITLSKNAQKLLEIQTSTVKRSKAFAEVNLTGMIDYDETQSAQIVAHFSGRVEQLYANYTGMHVKKGTHLAKVFSPDLSVLQGEILMYYNTVKNAKMKGYSEEAFIESKNTYERAVHKAELWGMTQNQIKEIIKRNRVSDEMVYYAPINGIIIKKNIVNGQHFKKGDALFVMSDLSKLWLVLDAYEQDLPFLRYGQKVTFHVNAIPGEKFEGRVVYINPIINKNTRSSDVRVYVDNDNLRLKPGMFASATVFAELRDNGTVISESLEGKWTCPMHPQILENHPGNCPICGMKLVPISSMGYEYTTSDQNELPLVIPASSPLITGKRAVVYVESKPGLFVPKTVTLGPKVGKSYIVKNGLKTGDKVVTKGNFKIDSELQIKTGNSGMMALLEDNNKESITKSDSYDLSEKLEKTAIADFYFDLQKTLSEDNFEAALKVTNLFKGFVNSELSSNYSQDKYNLKINDLANLIDNMSNRNTLKGLRDSFFKLTKVMSPFLKHLEHITGQKVYEFECPMAFNNKGAYWFQDIEKIANPYFGNAMKLCGTLKK